MGGTAEFPRVFDELRRVLEQYAETMSVVQDEPGAYTLNAPKLDAHHRPMFFAGVRLGKRYISYHLMPVYVDPGLMADISPELRRRMQGKSCFNFSQPLDESLKAELVALTRRGFESYQAAGLT